MNTIKYGSIHKKIHKILIISIAYTSLLWDTAVVGGAAAGRGGGGEGEEGEDPLLAGGRAAGGGAAAAIRTVLAPQGEVNIITLDW